MVTFTIVSPFKATKFFLQNLLDFCLSCLSRVFRPMAVSFNSLIYKLFCFIHPYSKLPSLTLIFISLNFTKITIWLLISIQYYKLGRSIDNLVFCLSKCPILVFTNICHIKTCLHFQYLSKISWTVVTTVTLDTIITEEYDVSNGSAGPEVFVNSVFQENGTSIKKDIIRSDSNRWFRHLH